MRRESRYTRSSWSPPRRLKLSERASFEGAAGETTTSAPGYVLIVAIFVILIVMTAALLVVLALNHQMWLYRQERQDVQLRAMIDGALAKALANLWRDPDYAGTSEPFADGTITIETRKVDGLTVEVTVRATYWGGARAARATVRIDRGPWEVRSPPRVLVWKPVPPLTPKAGESSARPRDRL